MKTVRTLAWICSLLLLVPLARADQWKPATAPLMTRWAKDVSPQNALPEYPRPQMVRQEWLNLNGLWQLDLKASAESPVPSGKELAQKILVPFPVESALSGVMQPADRVWYRRTFQVPASWNGSRVLLHFGAVDWEATVFVNGKELGTHRGGFDAFSFDITDALKPGAEQELIVKVFDPTDKGDQPRGKQVVNPKGIWYTPTTGIWQTAWLEPVPAARIGGLKLVPDLDASCLRLTVEGVGTSAGQSIEAVARDGSTVVAQATAAVGQAIALEIPTESLKLWSPEKPFLYDLTVTLKQGDKPLDTVSSYFG
ncbi:MAG: sugar-binding domain-containing protein, partial [Thermoguttaceae bacterium]